MLYGIGTDITEVERIKSAVEKYGSRFIKKIFTPIEIEYCEQFRDKKYVHYAARFAVKESFSKAIGTGITNGFKLNEVGVLNEKTGKPTIVLEGGLLEKYGQYRTEVSISHSDTIAVAFVVMDMGEDASEVPPEEQECTEEDSTFEFDFGTIVPDEAK